MNPGDVVMSALDPAGPLILATVAGLAVAVLAWTWAAWRDRTDDDQTTRR